MKRKTKYYICFICGGIDAKHKTGCDQYKQTLLELFGDLKSIVFAADNGLLPTPPWDQRRVNEK